MEDNEWETIQASSSATQSDEDVGDAVVVAKPTNFHDSSGVAPSNHEGLLVFTQPPQDDYLHEPVLETPSPRSSYSSSSNPSSTEIVEGELPQPPETRSTQLKASFRILSSWVLRIAYGIRDRIGFWSIASVTAFASVMVYGMQWQRRRMLAAKESKDQLKLLINQKDEKIKQLLLQIDRMNEALSARRKVRGQTGSQLDTFILIE
ncbi:unnamed protein product [Lactuca saligna]|uniref:Uncharacterized protein n=1 Tax=Lactuca saligna TaxID=75948 RepID=A0AA36EI18_LACSI|nr:unnamed protein product [Lactuca saligna]